MPVSDGPDQAGAPLVRHTSESLVQRGFRRWTYWIARRRLRQLDRVDVHGLEHLREALSRGSVIAAPNHVCWWDAIVILHLADQLGVDFHVMIDQPSLDRYTFFRAAGGIGIDRSSPMSARHGLARARELLATPSTLLWVFPQGRYRPSHLRPMELEGGVAWLARRSGAALVPVGLSYPFLQSAEPAAYVTVAPAVEPDMAALEAALVAAIDAGEARAEVARFAVAQPPDVASRLLGWLMGGVGRA